MIKLKVPELLEKKGWNISDLMRKANIGYTTAYRLSKREVGYVTFDVLNSLCEVFDAKIEDVLEYIPDGKK
ncbi:MAG: helix-turn-helix transcriptional regulator [Anaerolineales bacterium]